MIIKIIFVIFGTISATIMALGICKFIESIILRKKSPIEKYLLFRAIINIKFAQDSRQMKLDFFYNFGFCLTCGVLTTGFTKHVWMGITFQVAAGLFPYFLSALTLRRDERGKKIFINELTVPLIIYLLSSIGFLIAGCVLISISKSLIEMLFLVLGLISSLSTVLIAIWVVFGGIGRLIKKIIKRLSRIKLPKLRLKIPPQPIPQT